MSEYSYRFCKKCGARAGTGDAFCAKCGAPLNSPGAADRTLQSEKAAPQTPSKKPEKQNTGKKNSALAPLLVFLLAIAAVVWALLPESVCETYGEAAKKIRPHLLKHEETLSVTLKTDEYNRFLGAKHIVDEILIEAIRNSSDPYTGERLGLNFCISDIRETSESQKDGSDKLHLAIGVIYFSTPQQEKALKEEVQNILRGLHLDGLSDYEKLRAIYRYICENVSYDYAHLDDKTYYLQYTAYAAALHHTAVCSGIADLFYCLANEAGVETHIKTNSVHGWNFVKLDGQYYYVDATWDLGKSESEWDHFLKGSGDFEHYGDIYFSPFGYSNLLMNTDEGYTFSRFAYGKLLP